MEEMSLADLGLDIGIEPLGVVDNTSPPPTDNINQMLGTPEYTRAPSSPTQGFNMSGLNNLPALSK